MHFISIMKNHENEKLCRLVRKPLTEQTLGLISCLGCLMSSHKLFRPYRQRDSNALNLYVWRNQLMSWPISGSHWPEA